MKANSLLVRTTQGGLGPGRLLSHAGLQPELVLIVLDKETEATAQLDRVF